MPGPPGATVDARAYVDESGEKGYIDVANPKEFGLLLGVVVHDSDEAAVRTALQPHFDQFMKALPKGMKPHITDAFASTDPAVRAVAATTRNSYEQVGRSAPVTVVYEAISASGFARRRDALDAMVAQAEAARRSGTRITSHPHRDRIEEELLAGFLLKVDALAESRGWAHVAFTSDTLSKGVREAYQAILEDGRSTGNRTEVVKGYDPATKARLTGTVSTRITVPSGSGLDPAVSRVGDVADSSPDALLLMADILVNSLRHHLNTTLDPATDPLNAPASIRGWSLERSVVGVEDDYPMDIL